MRVPGNRVRGDAGGRREFSRGRREGLVKIRERRRGRGSGEWGVKENKGAFNINVAIRECVT